MNMQSIMAQARKLQGDIERTSKEIENTVFTYENENILVEALGTYAITKIQIKNENILEDKEMLEDIVYVAINDVINQVKKEKEKEVDIPSDVEYINWQDCKMILTDEQQAVLLAFGEKTLRVDDLVELTQLPARRVLSALTILQVQGYVAEESGKRFRAAGKLKME